MGLLQRGRPETFVLTRLKPNMTATRSPGPGPIRKRYLANRKIIFDKDSAKAYKLKLSGVIHDSVVHQKKKVKVKGKWQWIKATFVKIKTHKLPGGKLLKVKAGTQHIDRCWKFIKERLAKGTNSRACMKRMTFKIRAAQFEYWNRGKDLWVCSGNLLQEYMSEILQSA